MFTRELVEAAKSMIDFYVRDKRGLNCDEPDLHFAATGLYTKSGLMPSLQTSTTLAKSTDLLVRYGATAAEAAIELMASIARASEPVFEDVIRMIPYTGAGTFLTRVLDYESGRSLSTFEPFCGEMIDTKEHDKISVMDDVSPIAKAIIARSYERLKRAAEDCPHLLLQKTFGLTVLHLSIGWPEGLRYLLQTQARSEIDTPDDISITDMGRFALAWPFTYAAAQQCSQSLELLLDAGCNLYPEDPQTGTQTQALSCAFEATSMQCARAFASRMARRKEELFALARSRLDEIRVHISFFEEEERQAILAAIEHGGDISPERLDNGATERRMPEQLLGLIVFKCLQRAKVPVHDWLKPCEFVDHGIYQLPGVPLEFFPIFEEYGFMGYNEPNTHGLRPIMDEVRSAYSLSLTPHEGIWDMLPWLVKHQCLDLKPTDATDKPHEGEVLLNEHVTGWHYLALKIVTCTWGWQGLFDGGRSGLRVATELVATIAEGDDATRYRDNCMCLCNHPSISSRTGQWNEVEPLNGCSPFSVLSRNYFEDGFTGYSHPHNFRHCVFQHGRNSKLEYNCHAPSDGQTSAATRVPTWQLELLRLLTFEALEMAHTCCVAEPLRPSDMQHGIFHRSNDLERELQQQRAGAAEESRGRQLHELMIEFEEQLGRGNGSARDLEKFIFGPWQTRVAALYDADDKQVKSIEQFLGSKVRTSE